MKKIYCLYHASCLDGFAAATVLYYHNYLHIASGDVQLDFIAVRYQDDPPEMDPKAEVYILDFSYSRAVLIEMAKTHPYVCVIDHHKSASERLAMEGFGKAGHTLEEVDEGFLVNNNLFIRFDMDRSGCVLVWDHFYSHDAEVPMLLQYVQDRDLWRFALPDSKEVTAYIQSWPFDMDEWHNKLLEWNQEDMVREGNVCIALRDKIVSMQLQSRHFTLFRMDKQEMVSLPLSGIDGDDVGDLIPTVNATAFVSETCHALGKLYPDAKYVASYRKNEKLEVEWSLRTHQKDVSVSQIASVFGGGGHQKAAGFTVKGS